MSKENFKNFARIHPELATFVNNNQTTWQKLYELYDIYGEKSNVWNEYFSESQLNTTSTSSTTQNKPLKDATINDLINTIKSVDLETVQKGISNMQKTIGLLQDLGIGAASKGITNSYEPRPMYKYFED